VDGPALGMQAHSKTAKKQVIKNKGLTEHNTTCTRLGHLRDCQPSKVLAANNNKNNNNYSKMIILNVCVLAWLFAR